MTQTEDLTDIHRADWVEICLPRRWQPYARLARIDRPVGIWLTLLPCLAALVQAATSWPEPKRLLVFSLGALIMRSAGSTANDIADRNFDGHVERTRFRPLATGRLRTRHALIFLVAQLVLAAGLLPFLNHLTQSLAIGLLPLVFAYPFCKRFTHWPQVILGAAFNWGMLMAWSDSRGFVPLGAIMMWLGAVAWQVGYDTVYAYVDMKDDRKLSLRSTAILFGNQGRFWVGVFYLFAVAGWVFAGWSFSAPPGYFIVLVFVSLHLGWQVYKLDITRPTLNFNLFRANVATGGLLLLASIIGQLHLF